MKIGIIIINYRNTEYTLKCLESLKKVEKGQLNILTILVDNKSQVPLKIDENKFRELNLLVIRNEENLGFAGGNNVGIKVALERKCDYVLILNNDTTHKSDFLTELIRGLEMEDGEIASPKIYFSKGREFHSERYQKSELGKVIWYAGGMLDRRNVLASHIGVDQVDDGRFNKSSSTDFATGCCMLVKSSVFEKIGTFDVRYFLYLEDLDLCMRAKKARFKIFFIPASIIWHENAGSTGGSGSNLQDYFITRNRLLFGNQYVNFRARLALLKESLVILTRGRDWQKIGARDFYLRRFGIGSMRT